MNEDTEFNQNPNANSAMISPSMSDLDSHDIISQTESHIKVENYPMIAAPSRINGIRFISQKKRVYCKVCAFRSKSERFDVRHQKFHHHPQKDFKYKFFNSKVIDYRKYYISNIINIRQYNIFIEN
jgi:hypothetical protein